MPQGRSRSGSAPCESFTFGRQFLLGLALLAQFVAFFSGSFLLFLHFHEVVGRQLDLVESQCVVVGVHSHFHHGAELGNRADGFVEALLRRHDISCAQRSDATVSLRVVGPQHQLRKVSRHLPALRQGVVVGEHVGRENRVLLEHHLLEPFLQTDESLFEGFSVLERMVVVVDADLLQHALVVEIDEIIGTRSTRCPKLRYFRS